jgi:disulfide oxidoreductase YuzD
VVLRSAVFGGNKHCTSCRLVYHHEEITNTTIAYLTRKYVQKTAPVATAYSPAAVPFQTALGRTGTYIA